MTHHKNKKRTAWQYSTISFMAIYEPFLKLTGLVSVLHLVVSLFYRGQTLIMGELLHQFFLLTFMPYIRYSEFEFDFLTISFAFLWQSISTVCVCALLSFFYLVPFEPEWNYVCFLMWRGIMFSFCSGGLELLCNSVKIHNVNVELQNGAEKVNFSFC